MAMTVPMILNGPLLEAYLLMPRSPYVQKMAGSAYLHGLLRLAEHRGPEGASTPPPDHCRHDPHANFKVNITLGAAYILLLYKTSLPRISKLQITQIPAGQCVVNACLVAGYGGNNILADPWP